MANYYITNDSSLISAGTYTAPDGTVYTAISSATTTINVTGDDSYLIDKDVSGTNFAFRPATSSTTASPTITVESGSTGGGDIDFNTNGTATLSPKVVVEDGVNAQFKEINLSNTDNATLEVGEPGGTGVTIDGIVGSDSSTSGDTIILGDNVTIQGDIDLNAGNDNLTTGSNVTVNGDILGGDGDDTITLGENNTVYDGVAGLVGLSGGAGNDSVTIGDGTTISDEVNLGAGEDKLIMGAATIDDVLDMGGDNDSVTLNDGATITGDVSLGAGDDTLTSGNNVRLENDLFGDDGADSIVLGDNNYVGDSISGGAGNDRIIVGDYMKVDGAGIIGDAGDDYIETGEFFQADGGTWQIYGDDGSDTINISNTNPYLFDSTHTRFWVAGDVDAGTDELWYNPTDTAQFDTENYVWNNNVHGTSGTVTTIADALAAANSDIESGAENDSQIRLIDDPGNQIVLVEFQKLLPCFTRGTLIETDRGTVAIEHLSTDDLVMTRDHGLQPIRWIDSKALSAEQLAEHQNLRPILIRAGALGENTPSSDLMVSPQHRVLVRSKIARRMFGADEVLVAAKQLCQIDGIDIAHDQSEVTYFHMLFDHHEVVISNGAETESLYTGPEALKAVGPAALEEIFTIFPELKDRDYTPVAARQLASGRMGRKLAVRHSQNGKALVS